jgi:hypothetical protein
MMKRTMLAAMTVAVAALVGPAQGAAQIYPDYRADLGVTVGVSGYTAAFEDVRFSPGWLVGAQGTYWFTPQVGLRANGTYTDRPLNESDFFSTGDDPLLASNVNLWSLSGDVMFRPWGPGTFMGWDARRSWRWDSGRSSSIPPVTTSCAGGPER